METYNIVTVDTTLLCSLYIPKGDLLRKNRTLEWYENITKTAGRPFDLWIVNDASELEKVHLDDLISQMKPKGF